MWIWLTATCHHISFAIGCVLETVTRFHVRRWNLRIKNGEILSIENFIKMLSIMFDRPQIENKSIFQNRTHASHTLTIVHINLTRDKHVAPVFASSTSYGCRVLCDRDKNSRCWSARMLPQVQNGYALNIFQQICRMKDIVELASQLSGTFAFQDNQNKQHDQSEYKHWQWNYNFFSTHSNWYWYWYEQKLWRSELLSIRLLGMSDLFVLSVQFGWMKNWKTEEQNVLWPQPFISWFNRNLFISIISHD